jgi:drug/metabolite transporter (DMT)-like permease|tara:strand:+ start:170 stop:1036 length:867 start_codon:yes stop_codon:yes gene_type:complete
MYSIYKVPGYILCLLGAFFLSWGGLLIREWDGGDIWQILFWRAFFFSITLGFFLYFIYKNKTLIIIKKSGIPGVIGGIAMAIGFTAYVFAMSETTVANVLFIISTQTIWLALFGYFFLKEKISLKTFFSIILAMTGILVMIGGSLNTGSMQGNLVALFIPINFAFLILLIRKYSNLDLIPALFYGGLIITIVAFFMSETIFISRNNLLVGFLLGTFQHAFGFICIVIAARSTPAVVVGLLMLTETLLGPFWVWIFLNEIPPLSVFIGGSIIIIAVIFKTLEQKYSKAS